MVYMLFLLSLFLNLILRYISLDKGIFIDNKYENKPQKVHKENIPRVGGISIFIGFTFFSIFYHQTSILPLLILISSIPIFFIGILEDFKRNISQKIRLLFISIGSTLAIILTKSLVLDIGFVQLPILLSIPFTIFALVGFTNSINMIDGFNGLASGIILVGLFSFIIVLHKYPENYFLDICLSLTGIVLGFFVLNFPFGKIFLGDSGAYLLGFICGTLSILMTQQKSNISPWFPVVIFAYPIVDVLFSIFRRKFIHKKSPFEPDKEHFHSLVYRVVTKSNWKTSAFIFIFIVPFCILGIQNHNNHTNLLIIFIIFLISYIIIYLFMFKKLKNIYGDY